MASMSEWQTFQQSCPYQPEIRMGLYEVWLSGVGYGPTQADRVLIHSNMLEQAHERRFVVSEMGLDYSNFEKDHAWRINYFLSTLTNHFQRHQSNEADYSYQSDDKYLLGMTTLTPNSHYPGEMSVQPGPIPSPELSPSQASPSVRPSEQRDGTEFQAWPTVIEVDDDVASYTTISREHYIKYAHRYRHSFKSNSSRTKRTVRMRKAPLHFALPEPRAKEALFEYNCRQTPQVY